MFALAFGPTPFRRALHWPPLENAAPKEGILWSGRLARAVRGRGRLCVRSGRLWTTPEAEAGRGVLRRTPLTALDGRGAHLRVALRC
jgi:hypothetical protein